jgi:hypothetical protein
VKLHVVYQGSLARNVHVVATIKDLATGETVTDNGGAGSPRDDTHFDETLGWNATHELFKKPGRFEVSFTASIVATVRGSEPWTTDPTPSVVVVAAPRLDAVTLDPTGAPTPLPYGTPMRLTVSGNDLWGDVDVTVQDLDVGRPIADLGLTLSSTAPVATLSTAWTATSRTIEQVGIHRLQVVATYGAAVVRSEPFLVEITYLVDSVVVKWRDSNDVRHPSTSEVRLDQVKDLVVEVHGVNLAGKEVRLAGELPFIAPSDAFELIRVPSTDDFPSGVGVHTFSYRLSAGGVTRSDGIALRRWKLESCGWGMEDGSPLANPLPVGAKVVMRAEGWGFPDTSGFLVFKKDQAEILLWERDDGQNTSNVPQPLINNDDQVDWWKVDVKDSVALNPWTTIHEEEVAILGFNNAEYYFEVTLQDEKCTSGELSVRPPQ